MGSNQMVQRKAHSVFADLDCYCCMVSSLRKFTMKGIRAIFGLLPGVSVALLTVTVVSAQSIGDTEAESMLRCAALEEDAARLACFDQLLSQPSPQDADSAESPAPVTPAPPRPATVDATPSAVPPEEPAPAVLNDDIGRETLGPKDGEQLMVRGRIVSCRKDRNSKYVFYFDNGQVWRQKDNKNVTWKECDFEVTISKDIFGYRMIRDGDKKQIRIGRET